LIVDAVYSTEHILVTPQWLAERLTQPDVKLLDARGERSYLTGHIAGAVPVGANAFKAESSSETCTQDEFARQAGELGISANDTVVCYEDISGPLAARLWWVFTRFGHAGVRFLNGGLTQWTASGYPLTTERTIPTAAAYTLSQPLDEMNCSLEDAIAAYGRQAALFWDTRTEPEYLGQEGPPGTPPDRMGHIPGAMRLEWDELIDSESGCFKSPEEMRATLTAHGIRPEREILTY
jgi:thiosulfate/3-mercaptopyruvate sulfurtransferase